MTRTRITALLLTLCCLLGLCGCAGGAHYTTDKLNVWIWDESQRTALEELARPWAERAGVEVDFFVKDRESYWADLSRGILPDLMWVDDAHLASLAGGGRLLALDERLSKGNKLGLKDFSATVRETLRYEGRTYGVPIQGEVYALWYNKALFDSVKMSYPDESWTWLQVRNAAAQLTNRNSGVYGIVLPCGDTSAWYQIIYAAGGRVVGTDEAGKPVSGWLEGGTVTAMDLIASMVTDAMPSHLIMEQVGAAELFANGDVAMILQNRTQGEALLERGGGQWACTLLPYWDLDGSGDCTEGERVCLTEATGWAISANSTDPDAAFDLLQVLGGSDARKTLNPTEEPQPTAEGEAEPAPGPLDAYDRMETEAVLLPRPRQMSGEDWEDCVVESTMYVAWNDPTRMSSMLIQQDSYTQSQLNGRKGAEDSGDAGANQ